MLIVTRTELSVGCPENEGYISSCYQNEGMKKYGILIIGISV